MCEATGLAAAAKAERPAAVADLTYPRSVTPGIETHLDGPTMPEPGIYVGLDWIRCTGKDSSIERVRDFLVGLFGTESNPCRGAQWFKHGDLWEPGVMLSWGHRAEILQVDVQGQRLRTLDGAARVVLLDGLMSLGLKPTRLDGALDWSGQDVSICQNATKSCQRGELCMLRKYGLNDQFTAQGQPTRRHLNLGNRESAVCARIYDKGLEQGVAEQGQWERLEIEWKTDRAPEVGKAVCLAGPTWPDVLVSLIFGAMDFREANGRSEMRRRPQAAWWATLIGGRSTIRTAAASEDRSFEQWANWLRRSCGRRLLELAAAVDEPVGRVVEWLLAGLEPGRIGGPVLEKFKRAYAGEVGREVCA